MIASGEQSPLVSGAAADIEQSPLYYDKTDTPTVRKLIILLAVLVGIMTAVAAGLSVVRTITAHKPYFVLPGVTLITFAQLHYITLFWIRKNIVSQESQWYLYLTGGSVIVESITTIILVLVVE